MKKAVLLLGLIVALFIPLAAQDTIHIRNMQSVPNYFVPLWPHEFGYDSVCKVDYGYVTPVGFFDDVLEEAWMMYTNDTLQVYGIAAGLTSHYRYFPDAYDNDVILGLASDTSCEFSYEYLRLYEFVPDSLCHIGEEMLVHLNYTPVSYYIDLDLYKKTPSCDYKWNVVPMYERFFSTPVTVADTFYVGFRHRTDHLYNEEVRILCLSDTNTALVDRYLAYNRGAGWRFIPWSFSWYEFLFPIIAPPDTTDPGNITFSDTVTADSLVLHSGNSLVVTPGSTLVVEGDTLVVTDTLVIPLGDTVVIAGHPFVVNPGDTLVVGTGDTLVVAVNGTVTVLSGSTVVVHSGSGSSSGGDDPGVGLRQADMLYRYTAVSPNPATQRATVTSSFGLERIEVYDPQGRQTLTLPATGYRATLDLSAWPRGTYLLRIHTPLGTTTKKLLVQ